MKPNTKNTFHPVWLDKKILQANDSYTNQFQAEKPAKNPNGHEIHRKI